MRRRREGNDIDRSLPVEVFELGRVPCVGEIVADVAGHDATDTRGYRVVKVVHLLREGDGGCRAEVYAEEVEHTVRVDGWD